MFYSQEWSIIMNNTFPVGMKSAIVQKFIYNTLELKPIVVAIQWALVRTYWIYELTGLINAVQSLILLI